MDIHQAHSVTAPRTARAAHAARSGVWPSWLAAGIVLSGLGGAAVFAAIGSGDRIPSSPASARLITAAPRVPLSPTELMALTTLPPEFGPLADPTRRASCLSELGYPASSVPLGARTVTLAGRPAVVLVLPGDRSGEIVGVAVGEDCGGTPQPRARARPIADTTVPRP